MDKISIRGLEVFANHGVFKEISISGYSPDIEGIINTIPKAVFGIVDFRIVQGFSAELDRFGYIKTIKCYFLSPP